MSMSAYAYQPLASAPHAIRLLRLLPDQDEAAEIRCELFEHSLKVFICIATTLYLMCGEIQRRLYPYLSMGIVLM